MSWLKGRWPPRIVDAPVDRSSKQRIKPVEHRPRREGDEMACSCGLRWDVGEEHP